MNKNIFPQGTNRVVAIAVDLQNDFCPGGSLAVANGDEVIEPINRIMRYTRDHDGIVAATRDWHPAQTPHFDKWPVHCVAETEGAEFHSDLDTDLIDYTISKGMGQTDGYSGFEGLADYSGFNNEPTSIVTLEQLIQPRSTKERVAVIIGGLATDYCVLNTVLDATAQAKRVHDAQQGVIDVYAVQDAMRGVNINPGDDEKAIAQIREAGARIVTLRNIGKQ